MPYAPSFYQLQLTDTRPTKAEIVEFHDGEPLLVQLADTSPLAPTYYELIIASSQAADSEPDRIQRLNPDANLRFVVTPDQIAAITDGLTYYFTVRSYHEVEGIGAWFVRALGSVKNKPANRGSTVAPGLPEIVTLISATTNISATTQIGA